MASCSCRCIYKNAKVFHCEFNKNNRKLPRKEVGDFGCGDGKIYKECKNHNVHCFDLVSREDFITACDIAHVPLEDGCLDIAIFCLALMGTNWSDFIVESNRCLKQNGMLWVRVILCYHHRLLKLEVVLMEKKQEEKMGLFK